MSTLMAPSASEAQIRQTANELFRENQLDLYRRTDRLFAFLMTLQWVAAIATTLWISPRTWSGTASEIHLHVRAAILLGGLFSMFPVFLVLTKSGSTLTRQVIAIGQILTSALFIHLSGGRIEAHFHVFGSLAFLACYRDWRVLVTATTVVTIDHLVRGVFYPQSVFGVLMASPWRVFEHAAWVTFENIFLIVAIKQSLQEMKAMAQHRAELQATNESIESEVACRTHELQVANQKISETNHQLEEQAHNLEFHAKELDRARQRAEELGAFGQILDRSLNEIYIFDKTSLQFVHVNRGARDNIGYTIEELRSLTPLDIKPEHTRESFATLVAPLINHERESVDFRSVHRRKDGTEYPVEVHLEASMLGDRPVFAAVILDITERQRIESELQCSRSKALAADRAKSAFLANMSHEIRTPMTAILGFNDILLDNVTGKENIEAARTVKENGEYLINLINDILDLSKVEAGRLDIELTRCSPHGIVAEVASLMRVRAAAKNLPLQVRFDGPVPETIQTDSTRLRQLLINVVGNAIKFTECGSVQIVTRLVHHSSDAPKLRFDVIDTGIGIAEDKVDKVFLPFTQADNSTTRQFGGTGLGLTICKRVAELLDGEISVISSVGKGSTFSITVGTGSLDGIKLLANESESVRESLTKTDDPMTSLPQLAGSILLAEDGPDNQRLISILLKKAGAEVTIADNGQIAVDLALAAVAENHPYDVILMDMQMPILDGYSATRQLRNAGYSRPILALTAHAMSGDRQKCLDAGCDDYITKPIDREAMIQSIYQVLTSERSQAPNV